MRIPLLLLLLAALSFAQEEVADDAVVAVVNGKKMTARQVRDLVASANPQVQAAFARDPRQFMRGHALAMLLTQYAEQNKLDQTSPYKERLEFLRTDAMVQAAMDHRLGVIEITPEEQQQFYKTNPSRFREARVKMIYVPFVLGDAPAASGPGKKILTESEAKAKAESIVKQARSGADFVKLVKQHSEDPGSAAQDGDPGFAIRASSPQPPEFMRNLILSAMPGQVTDALRHENGYYVFRVESVGVLPYDTVRDDIYKEIRDARFRTWLDSTRKSATVQFENEAFFNNVKKQ